MSRLALVLVAAAVLAPALVPVQAHVPIGTPALAYTGLATIEMDARFRAEEGWDADVDARSVAFASPSGLPSSMRLLARPDRDLLAFAFRLADKSRSNADHVDVGFAPRHEKSEAAEGDQSVWRFRRDGTMARLSVLDPSKVTNVSTPPAGVRFQRAFEPDPDVWHLELEIGWTATHAGLAVWQHDDRNDTSWPRAAKRDDPSTWGDVVVDRRPVGIELTTDRGSALEGESVNLTARITNPVFERASIGENVVFETSFDGVEWRSLGVRTPDGGGVAQVEVALTETDLYRFRARTFDNERFGPGLSPVVAVGVGDRTRLLGGDPSWWVSYSEDGTRVYALIANASTNVTPTWEASWNGGTWVRMATGHPGAVLVHTWTPPDSGDWFARRVAYAANGTADASTAVAIPAWSPAVGDRTPVSVQLRVEPANESLTLVASMDTYPASAKVEFTRAPSTPLGVVVVQDGVATLKLDRPLPGPNLYVAWFGGTPPHAPAAARAELEWWPANTTKYALGQRNATGEIVTRQADVLFGDEGWLAFRLGKQTPATAGVARLTILPPTGGNVSAFSGHLPAGRTNATWPPSTPGSHKWRLEFYRPEGAGAVLLRKNGTLDVLKRQVELDVQVGSNLRLGEETVVTAVFSSFGKPLVVQEGMVHLERKGGDEWNVVAEARPASDRVALLWNPGSPGIQTIRAVYTGSPGYSASTSEPVAVRVADSVGSVPGDGEGNASNDTAVVEEDRFLPMGGLLGAVAALALAARRRR